jgi:hypothetical protein
MTTDYPNEITPGLPRGEILTMRVTGAYGLPCDEAIDVRVVRDDDAIAYAELATMMFRCWINTAGRAAHWEIMKDDGQWHGVTEASVDLPQPLRVALHRAASAGLVACGHASVRY